ncbi:MAG: HD domain-containing protein [Bdellovibrionaceae bacterium]|nr:HD domain-containing protein [Pseudobdellovibrionaceae bacterium]
MSWGDIPSWARSASLSLMQSLNFVEPMTYEHCCRVGLTSRKLAQALGLNEYEQFVAEYSGMFHDIGKIGVAQEIIGKPGKLDPKEIDIMKNHPVISEEILKPLAKVDPFFKDLLKPVRAHHERFDGEGYPDKMMGESIPLIARVILVADTYDAMTQSRPYRKGLPEDVVFSELKRCAGTQFDAQIVGAFLEAKKFWSPEVYESSNESIIHFIKTAA